MPKLTFTALDPRAVKRCVAFLVRRDWALHLGLAALLAGIPMRPSAVAAEAALGLCTDLPPARR